LHEIELGIVQGDIERFLTSSLSEIREEYYLETSWPSVSDTHALAALSNGLFIFAVTSVNFIQDRNYSSPADQLASLLVNTPALAHSRASPHRRLDELYTQVLNHAFSHITPPLADRLQMVLGNIILLMCSRAPAELKTNNGSSDSAASSLGRHGTGERLASDPFTPSIVLWLHDGSDPMSKFGFCCELHCATFATRSREFKWYDVSDKTYAKSKIRVF
jgi:hypothetical protein